MGDVAAGVEILSSPDGQCFPQAQRVSRALDSLEKGSATLGIEPVYFAFAAKALNHSATTAPPHDKNNVKPSGP